MKRYSYKFIKNWADLEGLKLFRSSRLGDRKKEYYVFFLNDKEYKTLKEVAEELIRLTLNFKKRNH